MSDPATPAARRYRFSDLVLDVGQRRVLRDGQEIPLSGLSFDLLRVLVQHAPDAVSHDRLAHEVWGPRRVVTPENLAKRVMLLRQALDDRSAPFRYVQGVRGHGYRLLPDVRHDGQQLRPGDAEPPPLADLVRGAVRGSSSAGEAGHNAARRSLLVGALAVAVGALTGDTRQLRRALRDTADLLPGEPPQTFELHAPRSSAFCASETDPQPALAPGGRRLAFVAPRRGDGVVWVQSLADLDARPLPGTQHAAWPFWSPDGRYVAFAAHGTLRRVDAAGDAAPVDLASLDGAVRGGAWAPDDTLLYGGAAGLWRVAADGGRRPVLWSRPDPGRGEVAHRFPVLLPGGREFIYLALSTQPGHSGYCLGSLDDAGVKRWLGPGRSRAVTGLGPDGRLHLLFSGDRGELLAQPFDAAHSRLTDGVIEVAPSHTLDIHDGGCASALAACERTLVYRPRVSVSGRVVVRSRSGALDRVLSLPDGAYRHPALSQDGSMLVVERDAPDDGAGLWVADLRRELFRRLGDGHLPRWSADGGRIVYSSARPEGWSVNVRDVAAASEPRALVSGARPFVKRVRHVTRDGVLFEGAEADTAALYYRTFAGSASPAQLRVASPRAVHARLSPDSRRLAFSSTDANGTYVHVTAFPQVGESRRLVDLPAADPQWRADGRELFCVTPDRTLMAVAVGGDRGGADGAPAPLFHLPLDARSVEVGAGYAPTPDGRHFVVAEVLEQEQPRLHVRLHWRANG